MYKVFQCDPEFMGQKVTKEKLVKELKRMASNGELIGEESGIEKQWVKEISRFSSEYDSHNWCANQVTGPPKVYPQYGDIHGAWAPKQIDNQQFLELEFEKEVFVTGINIYETYHAGGVKAIKGMADNGKWLTMWKADKVQNLGQSRIFSPELEELGCRTRHIRLDIDCSVAKTWVEIDAVELVGRMFLSPPPPPMSDLAKDFEQIINNDQFSDIQFIVESRTVHAHKAILCARSDYFRAMFGNQMKETFSSKPLELIDVDYDSFIGVLHFLYTNKVPDNYNTLRLTELWRLADKFSLDGLRTLATFLINEKINANNVVDTYVAASNSFPILEDVRSNCMMYMSTNMNKVVNTDSFTRLPQETMLEIIQGATAKLKLN